MGVEQSAELVDECPEYLEEFDDPIVLATGHGRERYHEPDTSSEHPLPACGRERYDSFDGRPTWIVVERDRVDGARCQLCSGEHEAAEQGTRPCPLCEKEIDDNQLPHHIAECPGR